MINTNVVLEKKADVFFFLSLEHGQRHFQLARLEHGQHTRVLIAPLSEKSSR